MSDLAMQLAMESQRAEIEEGDTITALAKMQKAINVLERVEKEIPASNVPNSFESGGLDMARTWHAVGRTDKALAICNDLIRQNAEYINWYAAQQDGYAAGCLGECDYRGNILKGIYRFLDQIDDEKQTDPAKKQIEETFAKIMMLDDRFGIKETPTNNLLPSLN